MLCSKSDQRKVYVADPKKVYVADPTKVYVGFALRYPRHPGDLRARNGRLRAALNHYSSGASGAGFKIDGYEYVILLKITSFDTTAVSSST